MHARGSRQIEKLSSNYQAKANLDGLNSYRADKNFLDGSRICQEAIKTNSQKLQWIDIALTSVKGRLEVSIYSLAVGRYREAVEKCTK